MTTATATAALMATTVVLEATTTMVVATMAVAYEVIGI